MKVAQYFYSIYDTEAEKWFIKYGAAAGGWTNEFEGRCLYLSKKALTAAVAKARFSRDVMRRKEHLIVQEHATIITDLPADMLDVLYKNASGHMRLIREDTESVFVTYKGKKFRPKAHATALRAGQKSVIEDMSYGSMKVGDEIWTHELNI